jgi:hypothetical protein
MEKMMSLGIDRRTVIQAALGVAAATPAFNAQPQSKPPVRAALPANPVVETASGRVRGFTSRGVAVFRGGPGKVLIYGQSGGGGKVGTLMAMPAAKGLFHRAVAESGSSHRDVRRYGRGHGIERMGGDDAAIHDRAPAAHAARAAHRGRAATQPPLGRGLDRAQRVSRNRLELGEFGFRNPKSSQPDQRNMRRSGRSRRSYTPEEDRDSLDDWRIRFL